MACRYTYKGKTYSALDFEDLLIAMPPSEASAFMPSVQSIPSAPFVTSTDAWVGLAMKRMIAYAAENGFDRIAWTTGEQQSDRYDLSKQVDSVEAIKDISGKYSVAAIKNGTAIERKSNLNEKQLEEAFGKDLAQKIINEEGKPAGKGFPKEMLVYSGADLKVGGTGMKSFYDQIVPKVAKEITKKMGGQLSESTFFASIELRGEDFDANGFDITPEMRQATLKGMPLFSRSGLMDAMHGSDFLDRFRQAADDSDPKTTFAEKLAGGITDLKPSLLGAVPLNYMKDFARNGMSAVGDFIEIKRKMDTMRQKMHNEYDEKAQEWLSWARTDKKAATALSDLMHESTIAGVDPSVPLTSAILDMVNGQEQKQAKRAEYDRLKAKYDALPKEAQSIYKTVRDQYRDQRTLLDKVIMENIRKSADFAEIEAERKYKHAVERVMEDGLDPEEEQAALDALAKKRDKTIGAAKAGAFGRVATLRKIFESSSVEAPYFPLARYGDYFAAVYQDGKIKEVRHFEKSADQMAFVKQQREANYKVKFGRKSNKADVQGAIDPRFVADIDEVLADLPDADELRDEIYQKYLESLPDMSIRKSFIHRKKTSGYNNDALRSYSSKMFHGSYQIARLKYSMEMTDSLNRIDDQAKESSDPVNGMAVANEMRKRHEWVMNPQNSAASQWATTAAFVYYLGMSPAQLFLNASQTVMMGIPVLGSKYGFGKSAVALGNAVAEFAKGKGDVRPMLTGDEKRAMDEFYGLGLIDRTQTFDLAGIGETGSGYSATRTRVMSKIGWFFQKAEVFNREVTAIAAYRLARESGMPHEMAVKDAAERTWNSHFDYTSGNRARFMQNDWARVFLVFRQYSVNMLYRLFRDARDSFKGETPEIKREARRQLGALMGMYGFMAGAAGVPLYGIIMAIGKMFDEDDEDFEQDLKQGIMSLFGETMGKVVLNGVPGTLTNTDLTSRIGMGNLWFRNNDKQLEGKDAYFFWMEQLLGAVPAIAANVFTGVNMMMDGNVRRGIETMSPVMARAPLRGARYLMEGGADTTAGDRIADTSGWDSVMQAIGFTPAQVAERYDTNSAIKNAQKRVQDSRRRLLNEFAMATKMQDAESKQKTLKKIKAFNSQYAVRDPDLAITGKTLAQSMKAKARRDAMTKNGLYIDKRFIGLRKEMELE